LGLELNAPIISLRADMKVRFFDSNVIDSFWKWFSVIAGVLSFVLLFDFIPEGFLPPLGYFTIFILIVGYLGIWWRANRLTDIKIDIEGSTVNIKCGDLFAENGLKAISFNEYFDTMVDDKIISKQSLNGVFINRFFQNRTGELDDFIDANTDPDDIVESQCGRPRGGKDIKFKLSTIIVYEDFLLTAFAKFDDHNKANLTMPEYIEFLINFWDRVNRVYAQKNVAVPIFGSGITRIKEHKNIQDEDLLKIMLWTFKLSEMKFKYPAKLTIVIHESKFGKINLFKLKSVELGF
jgi:hypothetical protein